MPTSIPFNLNWNTLEMTLLDTRSDKFKYQNVRLEFEINEANMQSVSNVISEQIQLIFNVGDSKNSLTFNVTCKVFQFKYTHRRNAYVAVLVNNYSIAGFKYDVSSGKSIF